MFGMQAILELIVFPIAVFISFYLPGKLLSMLLKFKLRFLEDLFFNTTIGILIFTLIAYIFSWLRVEVLITATLLVIGFLVVRKKGWLPSRFDKADTAPFFLVIVSSGIFSLTMLVSGQFGETIRLFGPNAHDGLWYLAMINELKENFPPEFPGFAGVPFKGYHFFYFFVLAKISNIFHLPPIALYFHFFPVLVALLWGMGVYTLMFRWGNDRRVALWAVFLTLFGGSFAFTLPLQGHAGLSLDSAFGMNQAAPSLINPGYAVSIVIILGVLFSLYQYFSEKKNTWLIPVVLSVGLVSMFKVYAGIILIGSLVLLAFFYALRKQFILLLALVPTGVLFLATYWFFTDQSARLFFAPLWAPHKVLEDNIKWYGYTEKQYTYSRLSVVRGLIDIEIYALSTFLLGNLGTRLIGLLFLPFTWLKKRKPPSSFAIAVFFMLAISILVPLFFIQSGKVFEIIQLTWYFLFFCSLFAALGMGVLFNLRISRIRKSIAVFLIIVATLPSAYETFKSYVFVSGGEMSKLHYEAMDFLKKQKDYNATVLVLPEPDTTPDEKALRSWHRYTNPKIIAFGNKRSYLQYQYFDFPGVDITPRIDFIKRILLFVNMPATDSTYESVKKGLEQEFKANNIYYVYIRTSIPQLLALSNVRQVYQNKEETIYEVLQ